MRQLPAALAALAVAAVTAVVAVAAVAPGSAAAAGARVAGHPRAHTARSSLQRRLSAQMRRTGGSSSAYVEDLTTGKPLFSWSAAVPRLPASVEKLYTTSTALLRFGPNARLSTTVSGTGALGADGTWNGNLYIRGGGDPTFGSAGYDRYAYGGGATMQALVSNLLSRTAIRAVNGAIVGDESRFDSDRGTPATGDRPSFDVEGQLSGLAYNRGLAKPPSGAYQKHPAQFTAGAFAAALRAAGVRVPSRTRIYTGRTPATAGALGVVRSPTMATLIRWTNTPSDNFLAEMLLKDLGARFGGAGTTAAGVGVVKAQVARSFGLSPAFNDGSGLSYADHTSPIQIVSLLDTMATNPYFVASLAVAGVSGTLRHEMNGSIAQGRCRGKTGTLQAVSNLVGYCQAQNGDTLAFAFLLNGINPYYAHPIQNAMAEDLAASSG